MHYVIDITVKKIEEPTPSVSDRYGNETKAATYGGETELSRIAAKHSDLEHVKITAKAHLDLVTDL